MAGKNPGSEIARTLQPEIPSRLGGRISGNVDEETPVGRAAETGTRQRARIPRAQAVDCPGNGLAVEIADRERPRVVAEIVDVGEPSRSEVARSIVDHRAKGIAGESPDAGRRQAATDHAGDPRIDVCDILPDDGSGRIGGVELAGPIAPLEELARTAEAARQQAVRRRRARGHQGQSRVYLRAGRRVGVW